MTSPELRQIFGYKAPTAAQEKAIVTLRTAFFDVAEKVVAQTGAGQARAQALVKLQEASWAAIAAVVS